MPIEITCRLATSIDIQSIFQALLGHSDYYNHLAKMGEKTFSEMVQKGDIGRFYVALDKQNNFAGVLHVHHPESPNSNPSPEEYQRAFHSNPFQVNNKVNPIIARAIVSINPNNSFQVIRKLVSFSSKVENENGKRLLLIPRVTERKLTRFERWLQKWFRFGEKPVISRGRDHNRTIGYFHGKHKKNVR